MNIVTSEPKFKSLSPAEQAEYAKLRDTVQRIMVNEDGLALLLNAIVATGDELATVAIATWLDGVQEIDSRDLNAFCHDQERIIVVVPNPNLLF